MHDYAKMEMDIIWPEADPAQDAIKKRVLNITDLFLEQEYSAANDGCIVAILERVLRFKPLSPLTGEDDEWFEPYTDPFDKTVYQQNKRCFSVFRKNFDNSTAYDIDAKVLSDDGGKTFNSGPDADVSVTFPYDPPTVPEPIILNPDGSKDPVEYLNFHFFKDDGMADKDAVKSWETIKRIYHIT